MIIYPTNTSQQNKFYCKHFANHMSSLIESTHHLVNKALNRQLTPINMMGSYLLAGLWPLKATRSSAMFKRHLTAWRLNTTVPLRHRTESYFTSCLHITKQLTSRQTSPKGRLIFYYLNNLCFLVFYPTCFYISLRHTRLSQDV